LPFDSLRYALFLPAATLGYFVCPSRFRWALLLFASYGFYLSSGTGFGGALTASTILAYVCGLRMATAPTEQGKRGWLTAGLAGNLCLLLAFKYYGLFAGWIVPIGISFFTLQAIGYLLDVLRGERAPEEHLGRFAAYMAFFPHVTAGPIARSTHLLPQFQDDHAASYDDLSRGLRQIMWGLFQKVVVADNLAIFVESVYGDIRIYAGAPLIIATLFFSLQLYCDFAGYSNIALGSARLMGFRLAPNFDRPYLAQNLADFWRRWHISLSRWLADNIHKPMALTLRARPRMGLALAILCTFFLCGLWHGATWNFVVWGLLHGAALSTLALTGRARRRLEKILPEALYAGASMLVTFLFVSLSWVFFRTGSIGDALHVLQNMAAIDPITLIGVPTISRATFLKEAALAGAAVTADLVGPRVDRTSQWLGPAAFNYLSVVLLGLCVYTFGVFEKQVFIYAQF
jgi:D-alanyl-lipoteichoic acid acyltransferase DltB (MBOAT superfamily)